MSLLRRIFRALSQLGRRPLLESLLVNVAFIVGLVLIAGGVALMHIPAGMIVGGIELAACAALYARGGPP